MKAFLISRTKNFPFTLLIALCLLGLGSFQPRGACLKDLCPTSGPSNRHPAHTDRCPSHSSGDCCKNPAVPCDMEHGQPGTSSDLAVFAASKAGNFDNNDLTISLSVIPLSHLSFLLAKGSRRALRKIFNPLYLQNCSLLR
jgi:hypothetical protein